MTDWTTIAGGRCLTRPWRIGVAVFDSFQSQGVFLFSDIDWEYLTGIIPLEPLIAYGKANGLLFERISSLDVSSYDAVLLFSLSKHDQKRAPINLTEKIRKYLVLSERLTLQEQDEYGSFAKIFIPMDLPLFDERKIFIKQKILRDFTVAPEEWAIDKAPDSRDYSWKYHWSADFWIMRISSAISLDAIEQLDAAPLLSVVIPTYNHGRFLKQAVLSVLNQGIENIEVLVLDNASTDDTVSVVSELISDKRVRYIRNRYNYGAGHNWRNGLEIAVGRYLSFLAADDYFNPGHLKRLLSIMQGRPDIAVGYSRISWVDGEGQPISQPRHPGYRSGDYVGGRNEVADLLIFDNYMAPSAVIFDRKALRATWNPIDNRGAGDWDMVIQMAERFPNFAYTDVPGVSYRWHGQQDSQQHFYVTTAPLEDHLSIVESVFERNAQHHLKGRELEVAAHIKRRLALYPNEVNSPLGERARALIKRLEALGESHEAPMFSIILTTYNRPELLKDALVSVSNQTLQDFEVILVNDNGEPVEHLLAGFDFPITYIRQGRNKGLSAARNAGLQLARGRYVSYLDDDDIYLPNHLAVLAEAFENHPDSVIYTRVEYVNETLEDGQRVEQARGQPFNHETFDRDRLFVQNYIPVNTWAHPRQMLDKVGMFDTGLSAFEDWDMLLRLATHFPFVHVPTVTSEVHMRVASSSGEHMLGRERKNFPDLYRELYSRYSGSATNELHGERLKMLESLQPRPKSEVEAWLAQRIPTATENRLIADYLEAHQGGPLMGVLVLDSEAQPEKLMLTLKSLLGDRCLYSTLRILVITPSESPATAATDKLHFISKTDEPLAFQINRAVEASDCQWFMVVSAGDEFTQSGLMVAALELTENAQCRAIYGDQLQRLPDGGVGGAFLPGFNLDLLLSFPLLMARHWLYRRDVFLAAGGFDPQFGEAWEFELLTRLIEQEGLLGLGHIDEPLLITDVPNLRDNPDEVRIIEKHLANRGYQAQVIPSLPGRYRINYGHTATPLVSIVVNCEVSLARLQRCVESLMEKTRYPQYEILFAGDNVDSDVANWLAGVASLGDSRLKVVSAGGGLAQNRAAEQALGEYLLLLSGNAAVVSADWLDELLNHGLRAEVGVVGGKLLSATGQIDQAGLLLGLDGLAVPAFAGEPMDAAGYLQRLQVDQNYSAIGEACLLVRSEIFRHVGGLDASLSEYRDVDFCLRVRQVGYLTVWTPYAVLMHDSTVTQNASELEITDTDPKDAIYERWLPALANDPAYNRCLSLTGRGFELERDTSLTWRPLTWRPLPVVLAHPADPWGCGNYRVIQPFAAMKAAGLVDGMTSEGLLQVVDLERYNPDCIVLQRQIGDNRLEAMRRIKAYSKAFKVYELDDYLPNLPMKSVHRDQMPRDVLKSLRRGLNFVDRFVVSTQPLADAFAGLHDDIRVVENRLPVGWWGDLQGARRQGQKPRVGWAGGVGHTGDLELVFDVVRELANEVEWVFFGMCPEKLRPYVKEIYAGVEIDRYPATLASLNLDLAIAPVEQNLFNECKSNLRLLEYGACGFPVVCSDIVCYQGDLPVTRVKNRFKDWVDAIRMHIHDLEATAKAGDELRCQVLERWMLDGENLVQWQAAWLPD